MKPKKAACRLCGKITTDLYWRHPRSCRDSDAPYCARCYEDEFRRGMNERMDELTRKPKGRLTREYRAKAKKWIATPSSELEEPETNFPECFMPSSWIGGN